MSPPPAAVDVEVLGVTDTIGVPVPDPLRQNADEHRWAVEDILPHREKSEPMPTSVAAFASTDWFKSKSSSKKPKAKRWDHRITTESASRHGSSLKLAMKHFRPGMISLGGGLPSSEYFPFDSIDIKVPISPHFSELETSQTGQVFSARKHDVQDQTSQFDLSIALNYCQSTGPGQLLRFVTEHSELVHSPPYADWDCTLTAGSTSALDISFRTFCNPGDYILTEEYSFSTAIETAGPLGLKIQGIKMDAHGLLATDLDDILSNWNVVERKAPKPFLLYTVPTGHNPTAATQPLERRRAIYAVAEKHDLFILEDEPYYFLQMEPYIPGTTANTMHPSPTTPPYFTPPTSIPTFLTSLIPSYLSLDTSGRILRLDSFSKIISPGARAGWLTGPRQIIERFVRAHEVSVQSPSGFSSIVLFKLLEEAWGHTGFLHWLMFLRAAYTRRRDVIVSACERYLPSSVASWIAPQAGMFHWIRIDATQHPAYNSSTFDFAALEALEERVFLAAVTRGVLLSRGTWFRAQRGTDTDLFFRTTFAAVPEEKIVEGIERLGDALKGEFGLETNGNVVEMNGHGNGHGNGHVIEMNGH